MTCWPTEDNLMRCWPTEDIEMTSLGLAVVYVLCKRTSLMSLQTVHIWWQCPRRVS